MATLNRILIILIAIMTLGAAFLSFRLFEKRNDFRDRAEDLAETVKAVTESLDRQSNTRVQRHITFSPAEPGLPESGTLSWQNYENRTAYRDNLNQVKNLADAINEQRNHLASEMRAIAVELGTPVEELSVEDLTNAADAGIYRESAAKILRLAAASNERSEALIRTIVSTANIIESPVDENQLRARNTVITEDGDEVLGSFQHDQPLDRYSTAVNNLNTRAIDYASTLAKAISQISEFDWNTTATRIQDRDNYSPALTTLANDFDSLNERLVERRLLLARVDSLENNLKQVNEELEEVIGDRTQLRAQVQELEAIKERYERLVGTPSDDPREVELNPDLQGNVVSVNDQWDFVILDLGSEQVYRNAELLVARDGNYIGRVIITNVSGNVSVAEIIQETKQAPIRVNDLVIPPAASRPQADAQQ